MPGFYRQAGLAAAPDMASSGARITPPPLKLQTKEKTRKKQSGRNWADSAPGPK